MSIANKIALITGCSSGIGLALTQRLAEEGCIVYATTRNLEKAKYLKQLIVKFGMVLWKTVSQQFTNVYNDISGNHYMVGLADKK